MPLSLAQIPRAFRPLLCFTGRAYLRALPATGAWARLVQRRKNAPLLVPAAHSAVRRHVDPTALQSCSSGALRYAVLLLVPARVGARDRCAPRCRRRAHARTRCLAPPSFSASRFLQLRRSVFSR